MNRNQIQTLLLSSLCCVVLLSGCSRGRGILGVDCCAEIQEGAIPEPAGSKVCNWQTAQTENATADQAVLYQCDFVGSSATLSPAARERIQRLVHRGSANRLPWVVEPSSNVNLDQARVQSVVNQLAQLGHSTRDVTIASPPALGLSGPLAEQAAASVGRSGGSASSSATGGSFPGGGF